MAEYTAGAVAVPVVPTFKGFHKAIGQQMAGLAPAAGKAGDEAGKRIASGVSRSVGKVGANVGTSIASGIAGATGKVGGAVGRRIHSGIGAALARTGESAGLRIGTGLESAIGASMTRIEARGRTAGARLFAGFRAPITKIGGLGATVFGRFGFDARTAAGLAGVAAVGMGVKFDAALEQATQGFTTMLGSAQKAKTFLGSLQAFAAKTPFEFPQLVTASQRLIAFGFQAKQVIPTLTAIGDTAAGLGAGAEGVNQIVTAIGQIQAKGKVQGDELLQLTEAGIPALRILANQFGVSTAKMQAMVSDGVVPASKAVPMLLQGMSKGTEGAAGKTTAFAGLMQKQSTTLVGVWSNFVDVANRRLGQLVAPALPYVKAGLTKLTGLMQTGIGSAFSSKSGGKVLAGLKGLAGSVREFVTGSLVPAFRNMKTALAPTLRAVGGLLSSVLVPAFKTLGGVLTGVIGPTLRSVTGFLADHKTALQGVLTVVAAGIAAYVALRAPMMVMTGVVRTIGVVTRLWGAAQAALNLIMSANPIGLVIIAIAALVAGVIFAYKHFEGFRNVVNAVFGWLKTAVIATIGFVRDHWRLILAIVLGPLGILIGLVTKYWRQIYHAVAAAVGWVIGFVKSHWRLIISIIGGPLGLVVALVTKYWGKIKSTTSSLMSAILGAVKRGLSVVRGAFAAGVSAIGTAWGKLRDAAKKPVNFVIGTVWNKGIVGLWNKVMGWLHLPGGLKLGKVPLLASGGELSAVQPMKTNRPTAIVGEGNPRYPEYVIPTDPKFRGRASALWAAAGSDMQMLASGGILGGVLGGIKKAAGKVLNLGKGALALITNPKKVWDRLAGQMVPSASHLGVDMWGKAIAKVPEKLLGQVWGAAKQVIKAFSDGYGAGGDPYGVVKAALRHVGQGDDRGENNNRWTRAWGMPGAPWCAIFVSEMIKEARAQRHYPGYPTAAVAGYNGRMRHVPVGSGRGGDLAVYRGGGHINIIVGKKGGAYDTVGGNQNSVVQHGIRGGQTSVLRPMASGGILGRQAAQIFRREAPHNADPHEMSTPLVRLMRSLPVGQMGNVARVLAGSGLEVVNAGVYDDGGIIPPGLSLVANASRKPEALLSNAQWSAVTRSRTGDAPLIGTVVQQLPPGASPEEYFAELSFGLRRTRRGGVYARD